MTKNLLIVSLFIFSSLKIYSQCTPDNTIVKPGFYPNKLPSATVGIAYNEVISFKVLKDTTVVIFGSPTLATIDSAKITNVLGIPDGMSFDLNKKSKTYTPAETGCALVSGTPTKAATYQLKICLILFAKVSGFGVSQADTIENFSITVQGTNSIKSSLFNPKMAYPNPLSSNQLTLNSELIIPGTYISIYNYQGQLIEKIRYNGSDNSLKFDYPKGLYLLNFEYQNNHRQVKLIKT